MALCYLSDNKKKLRRFRNFVQEYMELRHMTQSDVAREMGLTQSWFSKNLRAGTFTIAEIIGIGYVLKFDWAELGRILSD